MFAPIVASILVLDELITFGLSAVLGRGGGVGAWLLLIACIVACRPRLNGRAIAMIMLATALLAVSVEDLSVSTIYLIMLTFLTFVIWASRLYPPLAGSRAFLVGLEIILAARAASALGFDLFERLSATEANRPTGLYSEPSHLAYYVGILYLLAAQCRPSDRRRAGLVGLVTLVSAFSASAILPIGIILADWSRYARHRKTVLLVACAGSAVLIGFQWDYLLTRLIFSVDDGTSLTLQVLIYYYGLFAAHLSAAPFDSFGPDGFRKAYDVYSVQLGYMHDDLNSADGSFLAVKLMVELGSGFLLLFLTVVFARVRRAGGVAAGLLLAQYIFLRGFGLTSAVVVALVLVVAFQASRPPLFKVLRLGHATEPAIPTPRASRRVRRYLPKTKSANRGFRM